MKIRSTFFIFYAVSIFSLSSCTSKKTAISKSDTPTVGISQKQISDSYYKTQNSFKTLYLKTDIDYQDEKRAQSVSAEIKIEKDKMILVSVRFLGFTVAKALITPNKVQYYEKLGSKYFEGDYSTISNWLGTDLDFQKIQNMIIGQPFDDLSKGKYAVEIKDGNYQLKDISSKSIEKMFTIASSNFMLLNQEISQSQKNRKVVVSYADHQEYAEGFLPKYADIIATQNEKNTKVKIEITTAKYNEDLTFPYSVPNGYSKIEMGQ